MTRIQSASRKPKSLARLIAEEAFSRPAPNPAANAPVVRVIARKTILKPVAAPMPKAAPALPATDEALRKPRVFVIRQQGDGGAAVAAQPVAAEHPAALGRPVRARRRAAAPVRVVYSAPERPATAPESRPPSLALMAGSLAGLEPTLEIIRRAMAFDFSDPAIVAEWEQLSRTAGQLSESIAA